MQFPKTTPDIRNAIEPRKFGIILLDSENANSRPSAMVIIAKAIFIFSPTLLFSHGTGLPTAQGQARLSYPKHELRWGVFLKGWPQTQSGVWYLETLLKARLLSFKFLFCFAPV